MEMSGLLLAGSQTAAAALVAGVWQGLLLAAMIWICLKLTPKSSAGVRFFVWFAVFLSVAVLPLFSLLPVLHGNAGGGASMRSAPLLQLDLRWALGIAVVWLFASMWRGLGLVRNGLRLRSLRESSTPVDGGVAIAEVLASVRFRKVRLCSSPEIDQPCVLGFFAPRILVPEWLLEKATSADLEQIVLHEIAHLRRMDDWANLLQKAILVVFPLNPVLFWIEKRLCEEREMACDESVVRATKSPRDYAACLVNLAGERMTRRRVAALSLGAWERRPELAGRIHRILSGVEQMTPWRARALMAALLLATTAGSIELGKFSQLVAFTGMPEWAVAETSMPKLKYQDVVYREPAGVVPATFRTSSPDRIEIAPKAIPTSGDPTPKLRATPVVRKSVPAVRRVALNAPAGRTFIVFTQWETSFGPRTTVTLIQTTLPTNVPTSTRSVAEPAELTSTGWYFFQL